MRRIDQQATTRKGRRDLRANLLRERINRGGVLIGVAPPFVSADVVEFFGLLGFDWILLDGEHGPISVESCYSLIRAADAVGLASVVRIPANEPWLVLTYAESGADAILVPHIADAAAAEHLVQAIRYPPSGKRGSMSGSRAANYGLTQTASDYFAASDHHALPMAMIEDVEALEKLDEIIQVEELETFFIGPGDLAMSMGYPGGSDNPIVRAEVHSAARRLSQARKTVATVVADTTSAAAAIDAGVRLIALSAGAIITRSTREAIATIRGAAVRP
jgi:2-keto-3-deoxy-L-rhamnonate aldolase RhmA